jgi:NitT/TauT family transport system ATP-binding protein
MLVVDHLAKVYGTGAGATLAIKDLSFEVGEREFICIVGPSGCGKTTLLKCISGLLPVTSGRVLLDGSPVTAPPEQMALVFQEYGRSLFPWLRVDQNVRFPLRRKRLARPQVERLVSDSLAAVGLSEFARHYPWQLSGGMQQRVAIARALAYQPEILVMDEPFASVDAQTRADLEDLLLSVWERFHVTILFVTHDIDEAVYLGDRILVLTSRPTLLEEIVDVGLPRPRDQVSTKELAEFAHLRARVYRSIKKPAYSADVG